LLINQKSRFSLKQTLKPSDKLRLKSEFDFIRANGRKFPGMLLLLVIATAQDEKLRAGVICGKKFHRNAVIRNRARRLIWESFRLLKAKISANAHIAVIPRHPMLQAKQQDVQAELERLLKRARLIVGEK
jgi:ribonuclease P protein component